MNENLLNALIELIALFARVNNTHFLDNARELIRTYLEKTANLSNSRINIRKFYEYFDLRTTQFHEPIFTELSLLGHIQKITSQIKGDLKEEERIVLFLSFLELIKLDKKIDEAELHFVDLLSSELGLTQKDYQNGMLFILSEDGNHKHNDILEVTGYRTIETEDLEGSWIEENRPRQKETDNHLYKEGLNGTLLVLKMQGISFLAARYLGSQPCRINHKSITQDKFFLINPFDQIMVENHIRITYQELISGFKTNSYLSSLKLTGNRIQTKKEYNHAGISSFSFEESLGNMVIILCNDSKESNHLCGILSGQVKLSSGSIYFNGCNLHNERYQNHKMIGVVPRDPLYHPDNSICQNFRFSASLAFPNASEEKINQMVQQTIHNLNIDEISNLPIRKISSQYPEEYLNTIINIGIELIRDPLVMILDLPFDHLSPAFTEGLCNMLKNECQKGKLIMLTAINPNGCVMKKSDRLWIFDHGGYIIYKGLTNNAIHYFNNTDFQIIGSEELCPVCGNLNTDPLYHIIQAKVLDAYGKPTAVRRTSPEKWHTLYREKIEKDEKPVISKKVIPSFVSAIPDLSVQFTQYFKRELSAGISSPFFSTALIVSGIIIAVILSGLLRNDWSATFTYSRHEYLPLLFFLSVALCFAIGIIKGFTATLPDRKLILYEYFKNHLFFSFLNVKYIFLVLFSAFFSFIFTVCIDFISKMELFSLPHWLIYMTITLCGGAIGMLAGYCKLSVRKAIAFMLIIFNLNLLFSGYLFPFNHLPKQISSEKYSPLFADLFPVRWGYEALVVEQIKENPLSSRTFETEKNISDLTFKSNILIPRFQEAIYNIRVKKGNQALLPFMASILKEINTDYPDIYPFEYIEAISKPLADKEVFSELEDYFRYLQYRLYEKLNLAMTKKEKLMHELADSLGRSQFLNFLDKYQNNPLRDYVLNRKPGNNYKLMKDEIIQTDEPLYHLPDNKFGRSQFFASEKLMNGYYYKTLYFNLIALVSSMVVVYLLTLIFSRKKL